jgi:hypothetical protein
MKPSLISWNVRGLNEVSKRLKVRNLFRKWNESGSQGTSKSLLNQA